MRVRIRFSKRGKLRWTSHRDVARMWERALRRAKVPVAYSAGFSPRPRVSFGLALPTGAESTAEYLDVELEGQASPPHPATEGEAAPLPPALDAALPSLTLPDGMEVMGTAVLGQGDLSLQHAVVACRWEIEVSGETGLAGAAQRFLDADSVVVARERKGHAVTDDIRPSVLALEVHGQVLACLLATQLDGQPRGLRPAELLGALGSDPGGARVLRTHQWIERDGAWLEPVPATYAPARPEACVIRRDPALHGTDLGGPDPLRRPPAPPAGGRLPAPTGPGPGA